LETVAGPPLLEFTPGEWTVQQLEQLLYDSDAESDTEDEDIYIDSEEGPYYSDDLGYIDHHRYWDI